MISSSVPNRRAAHTIAPPIENRPSPMNTSPHTSPPVAGSAPSETAVVATDGRTVVTMLVMADSVVEVLASSVELGADVVVGPAVVDTSEDGGDVVDGGSDVEPCSVVDVVTP